MSANSDPPAEQSLPLTQHQMAALHHKVLDTELSQNRSVHVDFPAKRLTLPCLFPNSSLLPILIYRRLGIWSNAAPGSTTGTRSSPAYLNVSEPLAYQRRAGITQGAQGFYINRAQCQVLREIRRANGRIEGKRMQEFELSVSGSAPPLVIDGLTKSS